MMYTNNFQVTLMEPQQINKEFVFNEAMLRLDSLCSGSVKDFIDYVPLNDEEGVKYIITNEEYRGQIAYFANISQGWQFVAPTEGMVYFVMSKMEFYVYMNDEWQVCNHIIDIDKRHKEEDKYQEKFYGIQGNFTINDDQELWYLFLSGNCELKFVNKKPVTLIIKQNHEQVYQLTYSNHIMWPNGSPYQITQDANKMDIIKLYPLIEKGHYIVEVVDTNYSY